MLALEMVRISVGVRVKDRVRDRVSVSFACQHEVAGACQLVFATLASNQKVEVDE